MVQTGTAIRRIAAVVGLALVVVGCLLWWGRANSSEVQAFESPVDPASPVTQGDVGAVWVSFTPVVTQIGRDGGTWSIAQYGVTVTIPDGALTGAAILTFTPRIDSSIPGLVASHFFELDGRLVSGGSLSIGNINIHLRYNEMDLGAVVESTLRLYYEEYIYYPPKYEWVAQPGGVDTIGNLVWCQTNELGQFALAGQPNLGLGPKAYLPLVLDRYPP